jgi:hypothetical protein
VAKIHEYNAFMNTSSPQNAWGLVRAVAVLQLKLLLDALRDLALSPLALVAAAIDLAMLKRQPPRYFRDVLRLGHRSDHWIDVWSGGREEDAPGHENVDTLLARIEEAVRDPQTGARRARVLKRWAERQVARAGRNAARQLSGKPGRPD